MKSVTRFEANLLRILQGLLGGGPRTEAMTLLTRRCDPPACLGRGAVALVQSTLARGCVRRLARGGWRRERFLRGDGPASGRLWERAAPGQLGLEFSRNAMDFLMWLTAADVSDGSAAWAPLAGVPLTAADQYLMYVVYAEVRPSTVSERLRKGPALRRHALCRLAFADDFADAGDAADGAFEGFAAWMAGPAAWIVEAMQDELAAAWVGAEREKARLGEPARVLAAGRAQGQALGAWLDACEAAGRRDLARFLVAAASRLLGERPRAEDWTGHVRAGGLAMTDRAAAYEAAIVLLRALQRLRQWDREARTVGYFDEGYAASQLWKADWERLHGEDCSAAASAVVRHTDLLRSFTRDEPGAAAPASQQQ